MKAYENGPAGPLAWDNPDEVIIFKCLHFCHHYYLFYDLSLSK